jgi:hypothetical protein
MHLPSALTSVQRIFQSAFLPAWSIVFACHAMAASDSAVDLRAVLREHLRNPEFSLDRKAEYVVIDPAFIEPVLDQALKYVNTTKPLSAAALSQAKTSAVTYYRLGLAKPDGLLALEARIADRFAQPVVTRNRSPGNPSADAIDLDFGWMIGSLAANRRYGIEIDATNPKYAENFEGRAPSTRLLAALLANAARSYPTAERVSVTITFPRSRLGTQLRATFVRAGFPESRNGWVLLQSVTAPTTRPLFQVKVINEDFSPYRDGRFSFYVDCAPLASAARTPQFVAPLNEEQQRQCLN